MKNAALLLLCFLAVPARAQYANVQINKENRTISVSADYTLSVDAEVAVLHIAYRNSSLQRDVAYRENLEGASRIQKAFADLHISDSAIQTETLGLQLVQPDEEEKMKQPPHYAAVQGWTVRVNAASAQSVIDASVKAGANDITAPDWEVIDPVALEGRANAAALEEARRIAEQMAKGLGAQIGDLVFASNTRQTIPGLFSVQTMNTSTSASRARPEPALRVFPKKVERHAIVTAVFAIK
jgi:uncharacterized protein